MLVDRANGSCQRLCSRRDLLRLAAVVAALTLPTSDRVVASTTVNSPNVLFIAVDDLRPELGCYGTSTIKSPHIDALAQVGTVFTRAYCQQAICGPSRTSVLTGCRPDKTRVYDCETHFRLHRPDLVTLPQYFKKCGYHTRSFGKMFHDFLDDPPSWSVRSWAPQDQMYGKPENQAALKWIKEHRESGVPAFGPAWEDPDVPDIALRDGMLADKVIDVLGQVKDKPFFLAVGFYRPHLPFVAPKKYYDLYRPQDLRLASHPYPPKDVPPIALTDSFELRFYSDIPKQGAISDEKARELIHGYYATISYVDAQIGRVLDELDRLGLRDRTIVCLWGDHGWHLGDHGLWCKHTTFESATRAPLILCAPGAKAPGSKTSALVEFVDIYPTLVDLAGLPVPASLDGTSRAPLLDDPDRPGAEAAFSQYPRGKAMGYSMRTERFRYTEWAEPGQSPIGVELYDHKDDPREDVNLAGQPEHKDLIEQLGTQLHAGRTSPEDIPVSRNSETSNDHFDVGVGSVDITPAEEITLAGSPSPKKTSVVDTPLFVKAMVISSGERRVAIVTVDTLKYFTVFVDQARKHVEATTGIPAGNVIICASHTHRGPLCYYYEDRLITPIGKAVALAVKDLSPCRMGTSTGTVEGLSENRRLLKDGDAWNRWLVKPSERDGYATAGPADPEVGVLAAVGMNGDYKAILYNYACHPTSTHGAMISADYPGHVQQYIEEHLGYEVPTLFLAGACGDVNPNYNKTSHVFGSKLGEEILKSLGSIEYTVEATLRIESREQEMPGREHPEFKGKEIARKWPGQLEHYGKAFEAMKRREKPTYTFHVSGIRIGDDFAIVTNPDELFCEIGVNIKEDSPFKHTMVAQQTNGARGYVPTARAFEEGGYETWYGEHSYLSIRAGEIVRSESLGILRLLKNEE